MIFAVKYWMEKADVVNSFFNIKKVVTPNPKHHLLQLISQSKSINTNQVTNTSQPQFRNLIISEGTNLDQDTFQLTSNTQFLKPKEHKRTPETNTLSTQKP